MRGWIGELMARNRSHTRHFASMLDEPDTRFDPPDAAARERAARISARAAISDYIERSVKMATTYLRKAENGLYEISPPSTYYWTLLDQALETASSIILKLPDEFFEGTPSTDPLGLGLGGGRFNLSDGPLEAAEKVVAALKARRERGDALRRIEALENTTGRTPEEAESYIATAAGLREKHGIPA
jgi:hypothetical protein